MKLTQAVFIALTSVCLSWATPIEKRQVGGVLICTGADATGDCTHQVYEIGKCYNLTTPFYQNASTFAPDGEAFSCYPYLMPCNGICTSPTGCTFGAVSFDYEHKNNLSAIGWNHYIASFDCHLNNTITTGIAK